MEVFLKLKLKDFLNTKNGYLPYKKIINFLKKCNIIN